MMWLALLISTAIVTMLVFATTTQRKQWVALVSSVIVAGGTVLFSYFQLGYFDAFWPIAFVVVFSVSLPVSFLLSLVLERGVTAEQPNVEAALHCKHCGYNLTGNVSGVCLECGERT